MWGKVGYGRDERKCPSDESVDVWVVVRDVVAVEPWRAFGIEMLLDQ